MGITAEAGGFFFPPRGSRVRKTLLPRVIELLREADNPKFDQKSPVNGYTIRMPRSGPAMILPFSKKSTAVTGGNEAGQIQSGK